MKRRGRVNRRLPTEAEMEAALRRLVEDIDAAPTTREALRRRISDNPRQMGSWTAWWADRWRPVATASGAGAICIVLAAVSPGLRAAAMQTWRFVDLYVPGHGPASVEPGVPHQRVHNVRIGPSAPKPSGPDSPPSLTVATIASMAGFQIVVITDASVRAQGAQVINLPANASASKEVVITYRVDGGGSVYLLENPLNGPPLAVPPGATPERIGDAAGWYQPTPTGSSGEVYWTAGHLEMRVTGPLSAGALLALARSVRPYQAES